MTQFWDLHDDVLANIFQQLDVERLNSLAFTCKKLFHVIVNNAATIKTLYRPVFGLERTNLIDRDSSNVIEIRKKLENLAKSNMQDQV